MEKMIECGFRKALCNTKLPIRVFEDGDDIIVLVGNRVYVNIEPLNFCFVSDRDIVTFSR